MMALVINHETILKTLRRITHEILEKTENLDSVLLIGIKNKGVPIAKIIQENINIYSGIAVPMVELDISQRCALYGTDCQGRDGCLDRIRTSE